MEKKHNKWFVWLGIALCFPFYFSGNRTPPGFEFILLLITIPLLLSFGIVNYANAGITWKVALTILFACVLLVTIFFISLMIWPPFT